MSRVILLLIALSFYITPSVEAGGCKYAGPEMTICGNVPIGTACRNRGRWVWVPGFCEYRWLDPADSCRGEGNEDEVDCQADQACLEPGATSICVSCSVYLGPEPWCGYWWCTDQTTTCGFKPFTTACVTDWEQLLDPARVHCESDLGGQCFELNGSLVCSVGPPALPPLETVCKCEYTVRFPNMSQTCGSRTIAHPSGPSCSADYCIGCE